MKKYDVDLDKVLKENAEQIKNDSYEFKDEEINTITKIVKAAFAKLHIIASEDQIQEYTMYIFEHTLPKFEFTKGKISTYIYSSVKSLYLHELRHKNQTQKGRFENSIISLDEPIDAIKHKDSRDIDILDSIKSTDPLPSEIYDKAFAEAEYYKFIQNVYDYNPILKLFYQNELSTIAISKQNNLSQPQVSRLILIDTQALKLELLRNDILSVKDFTPINTPLDLIFYRPGKNLSEASKQFIKDEYNRFPSPLYLVNRYNINFNCISKIVHKKDTKLKTDYISEYTQLLQNLKERNIPNCEIVLNTALKIMPNKIFKFKKLNTEYFNMISEHVSNNLELMSEFLVPSTTAANNTKLSKQYDICTSILKDIRAYEKDNCYDIKRLATYQSKVKPSKTEGR